MLIYCNCSPIRVIFLSLKIGLNIGITEFTSNGFPCISAEHSLGKCYICVFLIQYFSNISSCCINKRPTLLL